MLQKKVTLDALTRHKRWGLLGLDWVVAGHAVVFPDLDDLAAIATPEAPIEIMGGRRQLDDLPAWLQKLARYWEGSDGKQPGLGARGIDMAEKVFCRPLMVPPLVSSQLRDEEAVRIRLTEQQSGYLRALSRRKRAAICGGAGTGKTLLAVQKARELALTGQKTLLLCYNRPLADHLAQVLAGTPMLTAMTFHQFCSNRVRRANDATGRDLMAEARADYPRSDPYDVQMPYALAVASRCLRTRSTPWSLTRDRTSAMTTGWRWSGRYAMEPTGCSTSSLIRTRLCTAVLRPCRSGTSRSC